MNKTEYKISVASSRRYARAHGWSLAKIDAAEDCASDWANHIQNTSDEAWNNSEWRNDTASYLCSITDDEFDGVWQKACGFTE